MSTKSGLPSRATRALDPTTRRRRRRGNWVNKTDLVRYIRCPYAFWLLDQGLVELADTIDETQAHLIAEGKRFQEGVEATATAVATDNLSALLAEPAMRLYGLPMLENPELEIFGVPDGVSTAGGALLPVEIKSHMHVRSTDVLELAFYWLLLEPYRTRRCSPRGYLILRRDGRDEEVPVELTDRNFADVHRRVAEVRNARKRGVQPRICSCSMCSGVMRDEIARVTRAGKDLSMLRGIGRTYAGALERLGIVNYGALLTRDPMAVVDGLRPLGLHVSTRTVRQWQCHAQAYEEGRAVRRGRPPVGSSFIAVDLEFTPSHIWLVGACIVEGTGREYLTLWADTPAQEKKVLRALVELIDANPLVPVVTWGGRSADVPALSKGATRHRLGDAMNALVSQHVDLCQYAAETVGLPIPRLRLTDVAAYFGTHKLSQIPDGLVAQLVYESYLGMKKGPAKAALRQQLIDYNRDDVDALVAVAEVLRDLAPDPSIRRGPRQKSA